MAQTVTNSGARLAGLIADLGHKLQKGALTEEQFALFLKKQNPFGNNSDSDFVRVDRSIRPVYPGWIRKLIHPELEATGPQEYQLDSLEISLHPKQEADGVTTGHKVFEHQQKLGLEGCLGLADLLAIQALGIEAFRRHFRDKAVFGWKSVVQDRSGDLGAPCLIENGGRVILNWYWLDHDWNADRSALRFAK